MISRDRKIIDNINIKFDKNFINSLSILSKRKIKPIIVNIDDEDIIIGLKCPVIMNEDTFEQDKKAIESDILKAFTNLLNSEICNRESPSHIETRSINIEDDNTYNQVDMRRRRRTSYTPFPCPVCGSTNTIGNGYRRTKSGLEKPKRQCIECGKCYTNQEDAIWKMKNQRQVITDALELSDHTSLRDTARQIKEKYNIKISHSAILYWRKNKDNLRGK